MSKRTPGLPRNPRDFYPTTARSAASALARHLPPGTTFYEPCAGNGSLAQALEVEGMQCRGRSDIVPQEPTIAAKDALALGIGDLDEADYFVTNPPWAETLLLPIIEHLVPIQTTCLLLPSDALFNKYMTPYHKWISHIITMPRIIWIPGTKTNGKDNSCWVVFDGEWGEIDPYQFMLSGW